MRDTYWEIKTLEYYSREKSNSLYGGSKRLGICSAEVRRIASCDLLLIDGRIVNINICSIVEFDRFITFMQYNNVQDYKEAENFIFNKMYEDVK